MERTFAIIKPDAVERRLAGKILARIEEAGFTVRAMRLHHLTKREAEGFYAVHRERPFFGELTTFMSSGPCVLLALEAPDAIKTWRDTMGATDPAKAARGHAASRLRRVDRPERDARVGRPRDGGVRAGIFLPRDGTDLAPPERVDGKTVDSGRVADRRGRAARDARRSPSGDCPAISRSAAATFRSIFPWRHQCWRASC